MSIAFFSGLDVLKYINGSLPPLLYIKLDLYQSEIKILVTMCSHAPKRGSPILGTSFSWSFNPYQVSSLWMVQSLVPCPQPLGLAVNGCAAVQLLCRHWSQTHPRPTSLSCHHPHALLEQGKCRQAAQCGLQSPGIDTLLERSPSTGLAPSAGQHSGTWATTFWVCSEENRQGQIYLLSFFTSLDVPTSPDQQQEPETVQRRLSIPVCISWSASQMCSSKSRSLL